MFDDISKLYESILINEMDERVIDYVSENRTNESYFNHIFGDKDRIIIPMGGNEVGAELLDEIRTNLQDFVRFDVYTDEVVQNVKLDPKYGQGSSKERKLGIGKAINALKIPLEKKQSYINWYAKYKDSLKVANFDTRYSIILSRAPVDIVRMSDHRNINSCHTQGRSHFQCAVQEAVNGGAIAYLVFKDSLHTYLEDDDFQEADLFTDNERDIRGLEPPIARLRIRRLSAEYGPLSEESFALPETRIYGNDNIPGFYESVLEFIKSKQPLSIEDLYKLMEEDDIYLRGGSYKDNTMNWLLNSYYNLKGSNIHVFTGNDDIHHHSDDGAQEGNFTFVNLEDELQAIQTRYEHRWTNVHGSYDVNQDDGEQYFFMYGGVKFDFSDEDLVEDIDFEFTDRYDLDKEIKSGGAIGEFLELLDGMRLEGLYIHQITLEDGVLSLGLQYSSDQSTYDDSDYYGNLCSNLTDLDRNHDDTYQEIKEAMEQSGLIRKVGADDPNFSRLNDFHDMTESPWTHLGTDGTNTKTYVVEADEFEILKSSGEYEGTVSRTVNNFLFSKRFTLVATFYRSLWNLISDGFESDILVDPYKDQMSFAQFFESYQKSELQKHVDFFTDFFISFNYNGSATISIKGFKFTPNTWNNIAFELIDYIDSIWNHHIKNIFILIVCNAIQDIIINIYPNDEKYSTNLSPLIPKNIAQLKATYDKYMEY